MSNNYLIQKQLKNAKGKRLLEKTILEYSKDIINGLEEQPNRLPELLENLEISEEDFFRYISGEKKGNIIFYDQALCLIKKRTRKNK